MADLPRSPIITRIWRVNPSVAVDATAANHPTPLNLLGQDQFFGAPGEALARDYPNPLIRRVQQPQLAGPSLATYSTPFVNLWENPRIAGRAHTGYIHAARTDLIGLDQFFGAAGEVQARDYPNPLRRPPPRHDVGGPSLATYSVPFVNRWENPRLPRAQAGFTVSTPLNLLGQDQFFSAPGQGPVYHYPNPLRPQPAHLGYIQAARVLDVVVAPDAAPFRQSDWPLPIRRGLAQHASGIGTLGEEPKPFAQLSWPNPLRAANGNHAYGPAGPPADENAAASNPNSGWITIVRRRRYS